MTEEPNDELGVERDFVGYLWVDDEPRRDLVVRARSVTEARRLVIAQHGEGHIVSLWNEEDARRPR